MAVKTLIASQRVRASVGLMATKSKTRTVEISGAAVVDPVARDWLTTLDPIARTRDWGTTADTVATVFDWGTTDQPIA